MQGCGGSFVQCVFERHLLRPMSGSAITYTGSSSRTVNGVVASGGEHGAQVDGGGHGFVVGGGGHGLG
jgi:hypothetical protein